MPSTARDEHGPDVLLRWMSVEADDPAAAAWRRLLDDEERMRADRFRFPMDRLAYTAAHGLLRRMLCDFAGLAPWEWRFKTEAGGKPVVDPMLGRPDLQFSLSHTRGMVACAVGWRHPLGLDVESLSRAAPMLDIANRYFAPREAAWLGRLPVDQQALGFTRLWTLKEAYVKATGMGLAEPLDAFALSLDPVAIHFPKPLEGDAGAWRFIERRPAPDYRLALAMRHPDPAPVVLDAGPIVEKSLGRT